MSYVVLARKYRPDTFDEVVGQKTVTQTLKNALASGRVGHAFLLSGARGVGKTTTARLLAKALNCSATTGPNPEPCGDCSSCREIKAGTAVDVQEIDGATNNGVEQVRELRESARYNPARDRFKIWIIDEVHMLSTGAFNALLKTLEEPPPRVKFIFATTEHHKIPDTILSRCQQYEFRMIPARELLDHLRGVAVKEQIRIGDESLARLARAAEGSARDALSLFDQVLAFSGGEVNDADLSGLLGLVDRELLLEGSVGIARSDSLALLELVEKVAGYGTDYRNFARELLLHFRDVLLLKTAREGSTLLDQIVPEERERMQPVAAAFSEEDLLRIMDVMTRLEADLRLSQDPRVTLEMGLLKLGQMQRLMPFAELVQRVEHMAGGAPAPAPSRVVPAPPPPRAVPPPAAAPAPRPEPLAAPRPAPVAAPPPPPPAAAVAKPESAEPTDGNDPDALLAAMLAHAGSRPSLGQTLRFARARLDRDTLVLLVSPDFAALASSHADDYRDLLKKAGGRGLKVRIEAAAEEPGSTPSEMPAAGPTPAQEKQKLMAEAAREPAVREALDLFGGTVVDVRQKR